MSFCSTLFRYNVFEETELFPVWGPVWGVCLVSPHLGGLFPHAPVSSLITELWMEGERRVYTARCECEWV